MPDLFSWLAPFYDRIFSQPDPGALEELGLGEGAIVLDIGGGTGRVTQLLQAKAKVVVVDLSPGMLARAKGKGLAVCRARAEALPFASGTADAVIVVDAFHHFSDHSRAAGELVRVLKHGGKLFLEEPDIANLAVKLIALGEKILLMRSRFYDLSTLVCFFLSRGAVLLKAERRGGVLKLIMERGGD